MFICTSHREIFRNQQLLEAHYAHRHLLEFANVEAYISKQVQINLQPALVPAAK